MTKLSDNLLKQGRFENMGDGKYAYHLDWVNISYPIGIIRKDGNRWSYRLTFDYYRDATFPTRKEAAHALTVAYLARRERVARHQAEEAADARTDAPSDAPSDARTDAQRYVDSRTPRRYARA